MSGSRKNSKRAFLVGGILVGIRFSVLQHPSHQRGVSSKPTAGYVQTLVFCDWVSFVCFWNSLKQCEWDHFGVGLEAVWGQVGFTFSYLKKETRNNDFFVRSRRPKATNASKWRDPNGKGFSNYSLANDLEATERSKIERGRVQKPAFRLIGVIKITFGLEFTTATPRFLSFLNERFEIYKKNKRIWKKATNACKVTREKHMPSNAKSIACIKYYTKNKHFAAQVSSKLWNDICTIQIEPRRNH